MVSQDDMNRLFTVIDDLGISREAIRVPLAPQGEGAVERLAGGQLRIVVPADRSLDDWLPELRERLQAL